MKRRTFLIYVAFIWTKTLLGLTLHPYTSTRETIRRPVLFPVIASPILALGILLIAGKVGSLLVIVYGLKRELIAFILSTTLVSIALWQILIGYLFFSFVVGYLRKRNLN